MAHQYQYKHYRYYNAYRESCCEPCHICAVSAKHAYDTVRSQNSCKPSFPGQVPLHPSSLELQEHSRYFRKLQYTDSYSVAYKCPRVDYQNRSPP